MGILLRAFVLGAVGGVIPGAVLTILLVSALQGGLSAGLRAFVWAMISEILVAGSLLLVAIQLPLNANVFTGIGVVGACVLLYFAWSVFKLRSVKVHGEGMLFTPSKILLLSATNAPLYIFWTTVCFPLIWQLAQTWNFAIAAVSYFIVFEIGWGITTFMMLLVFLYSRRVLTNESIMHKVFIAVSLVLAGFGVNILIQSIRTIL
jgi:threonine/homoserine/homoserine lactone efflux protein